MIESISSMLAGLSQADIITAEAASVPSNWSPSNLSRANEAEKSEDANALRMKTVIWMSANK